MKTKRLILRSKYFIIISLLFLISSCYTSIRVRKYDHKNNLKPQKRIEQAIVKFDTLKTIKEIKDSFDIYFPDYPLEIKQCSCDSTLNLLIFDTTYHDYNKINLEEKLESARDEIGQENEGYNFELNFPVVHESIQKKRFMPIYFGERIIAWIKIIFEDICDPKNSTIISDSLYVMNYHSSQLNSNSSIIAIIDGGIDENSELLKDKILKPGCNVYVRTSNKNDEDKNDDNIHATVIAELITRFSYNPNRLNFLDIKAFENGTSSLFDVLCALKYAINNKVDIMNLSWGYTNEFMDTLLYDIIKEANDSNILVVCSAGNKSKNTDNISEHHYPSRFSSKEFKLNNVISVAALNRKERKLANYSNYGNKTVDLAALGKIATRYKNKNDKDRIIFVQGTSFSTAMITKAIFNRLKYTDNKKMKEYIYEKTEKLDHKDSLKVRSQGKLPVLLY